MMHPCVQCLPAVELPAHLSLNSFIGYQTNSGYCRVRLQVTLTLLPNGPKDQAL